MSEFNRTVRELLPNLAEGVVLVVLTFAVARFIRGRVSRSSHLRQLDPSLAALITNLAYVAILVVGIVATLDAVEVRMTTVITALGISGLAVSLALQDVLRNFVAGIYILLEKPFSIGDRIALREVDGEVLTIELRTTRLQTSTGAHVIVPNSVVMTEIVTNRSLSGLQPYVVTISGDRSILDDGLASYVESLRHRPQVSAEPEVAIESLEAEKASVRIRLWVEKGAPVVSQIVSDLESRLPESTVSARVDE